MPGFIARKLCPELIITPLNFDKYRAVSKQVREILSIYDPLFCPVSLDEAYFDLTDHLEIRKVMSEDERTFEYGDWNIDAEGFPLTKETPPLLSTLKSSLDYPDNPDLSPALLSTCTVYDDNTKEITAISSQPRRCRTFGLTVEEVVEEIRFRIEQKTQLTASAGKQHISTQVAEGVYCLFFSLSVYY